MEVKKITLNCQMMAKAKENNILSLETHERWLKEQAFASVHKQDSDEHLLAYLRNIASKLGRIPTKKDVEGYAYLKSRLGPWPRILEQAGLKEPVLKKLNKSKKEIMQK